MKPAKHKLAKQTTGFCSFRTFGTGGFVFFFFPAANEVVVQEVLGVCRDQVARSLNRNVG